MPTSTTISDNVDLGTLSIIASKTDNAVMLTDTSGNIIWVNPRFEEITEYKSSEVLGRKPSSFLQGRGTDRETLLRVREKLANLKPFQEEVLNYTKSGKSFWLRMSITPIFDDSGVHTHYLAIESDVTAEKNKDERLQLALREQEELSRDLMLAQIKLQKVLEHGKPESNKDRKEDEVSKEQILKQEKLASVGVLTAGIAHEMNNPINFLVNGLQAFRSAFKDYQSGQQTVEKFLQGNLDSKAQKEYNSLKSENELEDLLEEMEAMVDDMQLGANQTTEIVKGLKLFARGDANKPEQVELKELFDIALTLLKNKIKHRFEILQNHSEDIGKIEAYPSSLTQVFLNILQNAIHAFPEGKPGAKIEITTEKTADRIKVRIKDNGSGIPDELKPKIFKPFFTTKATGIGTGLGLPICKQIIEEKHDGQITFSSQVGYGTEFMIILPTKLSS